MNARAGSPLITKANFLTATECAAKGWHSLGQEVDPPDEASRFRMEQGREVGERARSLYPAGITVSANREMSNAEITRALMNDASTHTLFEASFETAEFIAKVDVLFREAGGWHLLEVKSSFSDSDSVDDYVKDLAYSAMVLRRAGVLVVKASLVLLSRTYRFADSNERLFVSIEKTNEVDACVADYESRANQLAETIQAQSPPAALLVSNCRDCDFFAEHCIGAGLTHSVLELPNLHKTKLMKLSADGVVDLAQLPQDLVLTEKQKRVRDSALSGVPFISTTLPEALNVISWPCYYLDFETVAPVLPLFAGHGCHQQVLTQFSVHRRDAPDGDLTQSEFLADATREEEYELAVALLAALGTEGSILVYSSFEKTRVTALRDKFSDLAPALSLILERLCNLLPVITDNVYHPRFNGKFSIKSVMPALVPDLSYEGLAVANGDTAMAKFARMARGEITGEAASKTRRDLLEYCRMDTLSMVRLHEALMRLQPSGA